MDEVNRLDEREFVARFGGLFEHSPWVAEEAWRGRPFAGLQELHEAFLAAVREAPDERRVALIRAHPDLAGKAALAGDLTPQSASEQSSAGLDRLSPEEYERFHRLNAAYHEKFDLPFVVCVRDHTRESILAAAEARLEHTRPEEIEAALYEISRITYLRLRDLVESDDHPGPARDADTMRFPRVELSLPGWIEAFLPGSDLEYPTGEDRMRLVVELSRRNVENGTGGPFGAAIFDGSTNRLVAPGVNLVPTTNLSAAHAEVVAIMIAQKVIGSFDLGGPGLPPYELVASTEPCAMCFGAVPWSGVRRLVCGARGEDACAIGFDEGPKMPDWVSALEERGISVVRDVCREEAADVLREYAGHGGVIYNSRQGEQSVTGGE